jgi:DNA-binding IclR family transcriptional regulator
VRNEAGEIIAIVDVFAPAYRCSKDMVEKFGVMVKDTAVQISKKLGYIEA